ncbi:hypothetical protein G5584_14960 [Staphylococcus aureus]|nr:hypothetical protein [Staphylococcus aureus]
MSVEIFRVLSLTEGFTVNIDISNSGDIEYYCNICLPSKFNLEEKIRNNEFPFDGFFEKYIEEIK